MNPFILNKMRKGTWCHPVYVFHTSSLNPIYGGDKGPGGDPILMGNHILSVNISHTIHMTVNFDIQTVEPAKWPTFRKFYRKKIRRSNLNFTAGDSLLPLQFCFCFFLNHRVLCISSESRDALTVMDCIGFYYSL